MAKSKPLITVTGDVQVVSGQYMRKGNVAFMMGPVPVWIGKISEIPAELADHNQIVINPEDYDELFVTEDTRPEPLVVKPSDFPQPTMESQDELDAKEKDRAERHLGSGQDTEKGAGA